MPAYRIYRLKGGHADGLPIIVETPDDKSVVDQAFELATDCDVEVWQETRLVASVLAISKQTTRGQNRPVT
jgi:hypothetical protein